MKNTFFRNTSVWLALVGLLGLLSLLMSGLAAGPTPAAPATPGASLKGFRSILEYHPLSAGQTNRLPKSVLHGVEAYPLERARDDAMRGGYPPPVTTRSFRTTATTGAYTQLRQRLALRVASAYCVRSRRVSSYGRLALSEQHHLRTAVTLPSIDAAMTRSSQPVTPRLM